VDRAGGQAGRVNLTSIHSLRCADLSKAAQKNISTSTGYLNDNVAAKSAARGLIARF
jgi:hypothetical protein